VSAASGFKLGVVWVRDVDWIAATGSQQQAQKCRYQSERFHGGQAYPILGNKEAVKAVSGLGIFPSTARCQLSITSGLYFVSITLGKWTMSEENADVQSSEPIPAMQRILDNPFILLFIGVVFPSVFYIIWGIVEIVNIPIAP